MMSTAGVGIPFKGTAIIEFEISFELRTILEHILCLDTAIKCGLQVHYPLKGIE